MKKKEKYIGIVSTLKFPNKGVVNVEGEEASVIVKNTLPGQRVEFVLVKNKKGRMEGRLTKILEKSSCETEKPPCPHFEYCGGCSYQSLSYNEQKELKLKQVKDLFKQLSQEMLVTGCVKSPNIWEYRNKMEFSFGDEWKGGPLTLGLHKKSSFYDIVGVEQCQIVQDDFRKVLKTTREYFTEKGATFYHKMTHNGYLRHLMVRRGEVTGELLVCLVTSSENGCELESYVEALLSQKYEGKLAGILHILNDRLSDVVQADEVKVLFGKDYFYEEILGLRFKISPFSFFQTNTSGAEVLYQIVREYIGDIKGRVVFDLYSGTGTITQVLATVAKKVIGVEIVEEAVEAARENAKLNGLENCEFVVGDVLKMLDIITEKPDFIILDPPREGVHPKALKRIVDYQVERVVYISCKPTSLVRDLEMFFNGGYRVVKTECVDLFPWTKNVETVVLLSKLKSAKSIEVKIELDEMDLTMAESKATYAEIKQYVLDNAGFKVSQLYVAQVKRKHGLIERINYNVGEGKAKTPQVPLEKEKAIEDALRYFRMI